MKENLYSDPIITWSKDKTHEGSLLNADASERMSNPLCGDRVTIEIRCQGKQIVEMAHQIRGCLLCRAAGAHLASLAPGHDIYWLKEMYDILKKALTSDSGCDHPFPPDHVMFVPVRTHKSRHACVLLPYEAAHRALFIFGEKNENG